VSPTSALIWGLYLFGALAWAFFWGMCLGFERVLSNNTTTNKVQHAARMLLAFPVWPILLLYLLGQALWRVAKIAFGKGTSS
jgi:hypothetical protein